MTSGNNHFNEHDAVVTAISDANQKRYPTYKVLNNIGGEKTNVAGLFPDIIIQDAAGNLLFIIEVRKNGDIGQCLQQWKSVPKLPAFLYLVVPETDLPNAKSIAHVMGLQQVKFGSYKIDPQSKAVVIKYE